MRQRKGAANTQRGALRFVDELLARVRRAGRGRADPVVHGHRALDNRVTKRLREQGGGAPPPSARTPPSPPSAHETVRAQLGQGLVATLA